ncbi:unnamed protein product, partial [Medioppia subpectinata]
DCIRDRVEKVVTLALSLFYGYLVLLFSIVSVIRNRSKFFQVRRRDVSPDCLRDPALGTHHFIQLRDVKLHYVSNGDENNQTMLFIHGFPEFWYSWRHQIREFAKDYHVIAVDNRGYGDSDKPSGIGNYTIDKLVEDIRELLAALDKQDIVLVAHDWGGAIAWNFAAKHPSLLDRLVVLNGPHPQAFADVIQRSWKQFFSSWYMFFFNLPLLPELVLLSNDLSLLADFMVSADGHQMLTTEDIEAYKYMFSKYNSLTCPLNYYRAVMRKYPSEKPRSLQITVPTLYNSLTCPLNYYRAVMRKYPSEKPRSLQITVPTLVIWGKRDIALVPQLADTSRRYVNDMTLQYIENCSHWTQMDQPVIVNQYIRQYLTAKRD